MNRVVNCTYCGAELERGFVSRTGKYSCFQCKQDYQKAYMKRKRELKHQAPGLETIPFTMDAWWDAVHNPLQKW